MLEERYKTVLPVTIYFNYSTLTKQVYTRNFTFINSKNYAYKLLKEYEFRSERPYLLPLNVDYSTWGPVKRISPSTVKIDIQDVKELTTISRNILIHSVSAMVKIIEIYTSANFLLGKVIDRQLSNFGLDFIREVGNKIYHVSNNTVNFIYQTLDLEHESINKARQAKKHTLNFLTLDIETFKKC